MVTEGKLVKISYTLKVNGDVIDSTNEGEPFEFRVGSGQVIPGFEKALIGMKAGEKKLFELTPDEGYGQENPGDIHEVSKNELPSGVEPEVGMTLYAREPSGQTIPVRISEIKEDAVVINFNHPLAGKNLNYEVEIIEIQ
jgi:peptidylprolyl isomerase